MNRNLLTLVKKFFAFLLIASIFVFASYLLVYKIPFLPNGYEIETVQVNDVSIQSFNFFGIEKETISLSFSEYNSWMIDDIKHAIERQKSFLMMLFSAVSISVFLLIYKVRNGLKFGKAIVESNLIFAILFPLYFHIDALNRLSSLITSYS